MVDNDEAAGCLFMTAASRNSSIFICWSRFLLVVATGRLWCSYWLYILIRTGDYVLLLVISFLLVALYVPAGPQTPLDLGRCDAYGLPSGATTNVANEVVYEEIDDSLERAATTTTSLDAEQDRSSGLRRQDTMGDTIAQTGFENVSKTSNDSLLAGVNTPQSDEYSLKLKELMELYTNLQNRVIDMEKSKTSQAQEITSLKRRVRRLEKKGGSRTHKLKRLYKVGLSANVESSKESLGEEDAYKQGRIDDIDANEDIYLVNVHRDEDMFRVNDLEGDEVVVETKVASKDVNLSIDEVTLAQALAALKITVASTRPKAKWLVIHEEEQASTPTVSSQQPSQVKVQDKGKGIMVDEPLKMKKKDQVSFDEQEAKRLQAEFDEDERLVREKDEANVALTEEWNDIQAKIDVDYQLAQRLQAQEQEELTDEEKARFRHGLEVATSK
ncbi:hypothetical protein Tco_1136408 [Tanacetum coccineum]